MLRSLMTLVTIFSSSLGFSWQFFDFEAPAEYSDFSEYKGKIEFKDGKSQVIGYEETSREETSDALVTVIHTLENQSVFEQSYVYFRRMDLISLDQLQNGKSYSYASSGQIQSVQYFYDEQGRLKKEVHSGPGENGDLRTFTVEIERNLDGWMLTKETQNDLGTIVERSVFSYDFTANICTIYTVFGNPENGLWHRVTRPLDLQTKSIVDIDISSEKTNSMLSRTRIDGNCFQNRFELICRKDEYTLVTGGMEKYVGSTSERYILTRMHLGVKDLALVQAYPVERASFAYGSAKVRNTFEYDASFRLTSESSESAGRVVAKSIFNRNDQGLVTEEMSLEWDLWTKELRIVKKTVFLYDPQLGYLGDDQYEMDFISGKLVLTRSARTV